MVGGDNMVNLREKYHKEISLLTQDALANQKEATQNLQECEEAVVDCKEEVKNLKETARMAHKAFVDVIKVLGRLAFTKNPNPEEVLKATEPCNTYVQAAGQRPIAEERLEEAKEELSKAQQEMYEASAAVNSLTFFG